MTIQIEKTRWDEESIKELLAINENAVYRALMLIYSYQTDAEQCSKTTHDLNNIGFNAFDAEFLSSLAQQFNARGYLTPKQFAILRNKIKKYWRQILLEIVHHHSGRVIKQGKTFVVLAA